MFACTIIFHLSRLFDSSFATVLPVCWQVRKQNPILHSAIARGISGGTGAHTVSFQGREEWFSPSSHKVLSKTCVTPQNFSFHSTSPELRQGRSLPPLRVDPLWQSKRWLVSRLLHGFICGGGCPRACVAAKNKQTKKE